MVNGSLVKEQSWCSLVSVVLENLRQCACDGCMLKKSIAFLPRPNYITLYLVAAKTASHGLVFAQLYTPDGICHGLHSFVVPLRDPHTLKTYPGVTIADMGHKIGLNGIDNG